MDLSGCPSSSLSRTSSSTRTGTGVLEWDRRERWSQTCISLQRSDAIATNHVILHGWQSSQHGTYHTQYPGVLTQTVIYCPAKRELAIDASEDMLPTFPLPTVQGSVHTADLKHEPKDNLNYLPVSISTLAPTVLDITATILAASNHRVCISPCE